MQKSKGAGHAADQGPPPLVDESEDEGPPPLVEIDDEAEEEAVPQQLRGAARPKYRPRKAATRPVQRQPEKEGHTEPPPPQQRAGTDGPVVYVASVCDGIGGIFVALSAYTEEIYGHACESEEHLRKLTQQKWPNTTQSARIEDLASEMLLREIAKVSPDVVLLVGGYPASLSPASRRTHRGSRTKGQTP